MSKLITLAVYLSLINVLHMSKILEDVYHVIKDIILIMDVVLFKMSMLSDLLIMDVLYGAGNNKDVSTVLKDGISIISVDVS